MRHARSAAALLALAGVLTPVAAAAVVALHLSARHAADHEEGHDHASDLKDLWHGHSHETTTPVHEHPFLVAGTSALPMHATPQLLLDASGHLRHTVFAVALAERASHLSPSGLAGVGPPPRPERLSILRI